MDARQGDFAWAAIVGAAVAYELLADDLLSESTQRLCRRHPLLARLVMGAVAGHLMGIMPPLVDVFSARNVAHQWAVAHYRWARKRGASA
jgi:hypothetical protein